VIQITLNFTSIEAARAALLEIPASVLVSTPAPAKAETPKPAATPPAAGTKAAKPAPATESPSDPKPAAAPTAPAPVAAPSASSAASVDYPTLQKAVFALAGKSREAAAAVAASLGVKTFKELPEGKWAEALAAVNTALAAA